MGTVRYVAVLALGAEAQGSPGSLGSPGSPAAPPGVDEERFRIALLEDTYEVIASLELVTAALALCPPDQPDAEAITWPDSPVVRMPVTPVTSSGSIVAATLTRLHELGAEQAAVVAGDAPDLPQLLLGKLFRGLGRSGVAVCPAEGGGLVALAAQLPVPTWFAATEVNLDTDDALDRLRAAAPSKRVLSVGPGWHRIRRPEDIGRLDPGLEGWDVTRALLSGHNPWP